MAALCQETDVTGQILCIDSLKADSRCSTTCYIQPYSHGGSHMLIQCVAYLFYADAYIDELCLLLSIGSKYAVS